MALVSALYHFSVKRIKTAKFVPYKCTCMVKVVTHASALGNVEVEGAIILYEAEICVILFLLRCPFIWYPFWSKSQFQRKAIKTSPHTVPVRVTTLYHTSKLQGNRQTLTTPKPYELQTQTSTA